MIRAVSRRRLRGLLVASLAAVLAGCAGLPPALPPPPALATHAPLGGVPVTRQARWPTDAWWRSFDDPQLDTLIQRALATSPNLAAARARVRAAESLAGMTRAASRPQVGLHADATRQRMSENGLIPPRFLGFTWYTQTDLAAQLSYTFDFWGRQRAALAARIDEARAAQAEAQSVRNGLASAIASTYFAWQGGRAQLLDATRLVRLARQQAALDAARVQRGLAPEDLATQARLQVDQAEARRVALAGATRAQYAVLAALAGVSPDRLHLQVRPLPQAAAGLPPDARLDLLGHRPDLAALRWQVEAMGQDVRAARADFLPNLSLEAMAGFSSIHASKTLALGSRVFGVGPALNLPLFDAGLLKARYGVSVAQLDAAAAQFNQAVLDAAREVAVAVLDVDRLRQQRRVQMGILHGSEQLARQADARLRQGLTDASPALAARAGVLAQHAALAALEAQQLGAQVALIQTLGGGFTAAPPPAEATTPPRATPAPQHAPEARP